MAGGRSRASTWLASIGRLFKSATKPSREEYWLLLRICILGVLMLGALGFIIRYLFLMLLYPGGG